MNKKIIIIIPILILISVVMIILFNVSNTDNSTTNSSSTDETDTEVIGSNQSTDSAITGSYSNKDLDDTFDANTSSIITLNGNSINFNGTGATVSGSTITITSGGTYIVSGTLSNGQIIVNSKDNDIVRIVLNGVDITCAKSSPIYVQNADKTVIILAPSTENYVTDGDSYTLNSDNEPTATIFSKDDLTINGTGSLTINANYNDGIKGKDDLKIISGNITINAVDNGIVGKDSVSIKEATITIKAGDDGIKSTNTTEDYKGFVVIDGGNITITATNDGIQAITNATINNGTIDIVTGGGSSQKRSSEGSNKGLKSGNYIFIVGGTLKIDSADDTIHCNNNITITGGTFYLSSGDDGVHADNILTISDGNINITKSYEGLEGLEINISGGTTYITASDDGINASGGSSTSNNTSMGPMGQNTNASTSNAILNISGGYVYVNASGDGLDSNGSIYMSGGTVIVNGPTNNGDGAIDYDVKFEMTGGLLIAAGSSGMAESPSSSTVYGVTIFYDSSLQANTITHIEDESGNAIVTFAPSKTYQSIVVYSPDFKQGAKYNIYTDGNSTGEETNGLYSGGTYRSGTLYSSFTTSNYITTVGNSGGNVGGPGGSKKG